MSGSSPVPSSGQSGNGVPPGGRDVARRLQWALRAYPRRLRRAEGDVLLSLAGDLIDAGSSSPTREALGLVRGGVTARAGLLALAPWEPGLRRAAILISGALLAIVLGSAVRMIGEPAWPGWTWGAIVAAPALVLGGQLAGRRVLIALGALLLIVLGMAQANGLVWVSLAAVVEWKHAGTGWQAGSFRSLELPLLSCALPGALLMLASSLHHRAPAPRRVALLTVAWVTAGALAVWLSLHALDSVPPGNAIGGLVLNDLALCIAAVTGGTIVALGVRLARPRRDPVGLLTASLAIGAILPVAAFYGASTLLVDERAILAAWVASALAVATAMRGLVRLAAVAT